MTPVFAQITETIDTLNKAIEAAPSLVAPQIMPEMDFFMKAGILLMPVIVLSALAIYIFFERRQIKRRNNETDKDIGDNKQNLKNIPDFDDLIFETRNREYGAYYVRKRYNYYLAISTFVAIFITCSATIIPFIINAKSYNKITANAQRYIQVQMEAFTPPEEKIILPPPPAPPAAGLAKEIRYLPPEIVDTIITTANTLATTEEALAYTGDTTVVENVTGFGNTELDGEGGSEFDEPFIIVEEMPTFMGGDINTFRLWVQKRANYPPAAVENNIKGRVILAFIIEKDGSVSNITVVKGVHPLLDEEAIRVVSSSPRWNPGIQRGYTVRVRYTMPIIFQFD